MNSIAPAKAVKTIQFKRRKSKRRGVGIICDITKKNCLFSIIIDNKTTHTYIKEKAKELILLTVLSHSLSLYQTYSVLLYTLVKQKDGRNFVKHDCAAPFPHLPSPFPFAVIHIKNIPQASNEYNE